MAAGSPRLLFIVQPADPPDQGWFLLNYGSDATFRGDTWHDTAEAAKEQAFYQTRAALNWKEVTGRIEDALAAAQALAGEK